MHGFGIMSDVEPHLLLVRQNIVKLNDDSILVVNTEFSVVKNAVDISAMIDARRRFMRCPEKRPAVNISLAGQSYTYRVHGISTCRYFVLLLSNSSFSVLFLYSVSEGFRLIWFFSLFQLHLPSAPLSLISWFIEYFWHLLLLILLLISYTLPYSYQPHCILLILYSLLSCLVILLLNSTASTKPSEHTLVEARQSLSVVVRGDNAWHSGGGPIGLPVLYVPFRLFPCSFSYL